MTQLLVDYFPLNYDQHRIITESAENPNGTIKIKGILQRADADNQNGRRYPKQILVREADKYNSFIKERRAMGELDHPECVSSGCEILTCDGWTSLDSISPDTSIPTLNTQTSALEYHPVQRVTNVPYTGRMYRVIGKNINVEVTPNHRFVLQDRHGKFLEKTAQDIYELSQRMNVLHLTIPKTVSGWEGEHCEMTTIPGVEMSHGPKVNRDKQSLPLELNATSWFEFLGIYLAEGHTTNRRTRGGYDVCITQNAGAKADRIRTVLEKMDGGLDWNENTTGKKTVFSISDARLHAYLSPLGNKYNKFLPSHVKNASQPLLHALFNGYLLGDGTTVLDRGYRRTSVFSVSKQLMEDFQEVILKLGMSGRIKTQVSPKAYTFAGHEITPEKKQPLYRLYIEKSKRIHLDFRHLTIEPFDYTGRVHCVTVQNGTFYIRNKGKSFWSGNSTVVNLRNVSHNITEIHWEGDDLMGTIEVLTTPAGNIVKELLKNGIRLGVSSRGVGSIRSLGEGKVEVEDDFSLICFDIVSNPSTHGAFLNENINPTSKKYDSLENLIRDFFVEINNN